MFKEVFIEMYVLLFVLFVNNVLILVLDLLYNIFFVNIIKKVLVIWYWEMLNNNINIEVLIIFLCVKY